MDPSLSLIYSFLISVVCTPLTISIAKKFKLVTDKRVRNHPAHTHTGLIPRAGGVPIFISLVVSSIVFLDVNKIIFGILFSSLFVVLIGLLDDYRDVSPYLRFFANISTAMLVIAFGLGIPFISNPFGGVIQLSHLKFDIFLFGQHSILIIADLLAVLWLVWTMNMVNWSKGVDGQLPGFVGITAFFLGLLSLKFANTGHDISAQNVALLSFIVAGAYIGFLPYNFYPQKIMPGYGGGALAGFLLGILAILSFGKIGTAILILSVPTIDAIYTILRRLKSGKNPFRADWGHFHHRLIEIGWGKRRIAAFYWLISAILGFSSLYLNGIEKVIAFVTVGVMLLSFIGIIEYMKRGRQGIIEL